MKFNFESDVPDGLVLIDEEYLKELNNEIMYGLDIFLDLEGKTELIYDFPDEKWEEVRSRETAMLRKFCNSGKMIVYLCNQDMEDCTINFKNLNCDSETFLDIKSGKLILVNAGELIQCISYPELEMEKILEVNVEQGTYAVTNNNGIKCINCYKCDTTKTIFNNVIEL